jgi:hypothetical protein
MVDVAPFLFVPCNFFFGWNGIRVAGDPVAQLFDHTNEHQITHQAPVPAQDLIALHKNGQKTIEIEQCLLTTLVARVVDIGFVQQAEEVITPLLDKELAEKNAYPP